jgi:ribosomal-protein-alanine N-acetyltransferase
VPELQRLDVHHAAALLRFERENRAYFARSVPDRGDDYFAGFTARHAALLAEQAAGRHHFHVLVDDDGVVLARCAGWSPTLENAGSLAMLRRTGFTPVGEVLLAGRPGLRHVRELTAGA